MVVVPLTKIVRIRNAHINEIDDRLSYEELVKTLAGKGFKKAESAKDVFYETFENSEYTNEGKNTIISIGVQDNIAEIKFTISKAPSLN